MATRFPGLASEPYSRTWHGVQQGPWWLVESRGVGTDTLERRLYDADHDAAELHDLSEAQPEVVAELTRVLAERDASIPAAVVIEHVTEQTDEERAALELLGYLTRDDDEK
jgi:hypothetical protein